MRRFISVGVASLLLFAASAAPVVAARPIHTTGWTSFDYTFDAGAMCPFRLHWVEDGSRMQVLMFPVQQNGDQLVRGVGPQWSTVTNLDTGASTVVGGGSRQDFIFHANGTLDVWIDGTVVAGYFPTDAPGAGLWLLHSRVHDTVDAGFNTTGHSFNGTAVDLCAALGG